MSVNYIKMPDDCVLHPTHLFSIPRHYEGCIGSVMIPHGLIIDRIEKLARDIHEGFGKKSMTILCVLKGAYRFCQDLMNSLSALGRNAETSIQINVDFIRLKSYKNDRSTGEVSVIGGYDLNDLGGKNVLVVEDIIDTGRTMTKLLETIGKHSPKSVQVCTLLLKRCPGSTGYRPDYLGFEIPNKYIIGYGGFDHNEYFRDLNHICIINEQGMSKYNVD